MTHVPADVTVVVAPAGYGKTRLANETARAYDVVGRCDCAVPSGTLALRLIDALRVESGRDAFIVAQQTALVETTDVEARFLDAANAWRSEPSSPALMIFDNFESVASDDRIVSFVAELVASRPAGRHVMICSRIALPRKLRRMLAPDRTRFVSAADLRIDDDRAAALLRASGASGRGLELAVEAAHGWPMALLLLCRLASDGRLPESLVASAAAYETIFEYLVGEYTTTLSAAEFDTIVLVASVAAVVPAELVALTEMTAHDVAAFINTTPFLTRAEGTLEAHPIVVALVRSRYRREAEAAVRRAIALAESNRDRLRAAEIAIAAEDATAAASHLAAPELHITSDTLPRIASILARLERETILQFPDLWAKTIDIRRFGMRLDELVNEGRRVASAIVHDAPPDERRFEVTRHCFTIFVHAGLLADARRLNLDAQDALADPRLRARLDLMLVSLDSTEGRYETARNAYLAASFDDPRITVKYQDLIDATTLLRSGRYAEGIALLQEAARLANERCWVAALIVSLSNIAFEAWLASDEALLTETIAKMKARLLPGLEPAWRCWFAALAGKEEPSTGFEPLTVSTIAHLFLACRADGAQRGRHAREAVLTADRAGDLSLKVFARLALAEYDVTSRRTALRELAVLADSIELPPFRAAVRGYASGSRDLGVLDDFVRRRLRGTSKPARSVEVRVLASEIAVESEIVRTTAMEFLVIAFIALSRQTASRQSICDAIWPDADPEAAGANLKVMVHRLRKKIGGESIVLLASGYALGPGVSVDLLDAERFVAEARAAGGASADVVRRSVAIGESIAGGRHVELGRHEWYAGVERRLATLRSRATEVAARTLLERREFDRARDLCAQLVECDPFEAEYSELFARCLRLSGDARAEREEAQRFERVRLGDHVPEFVM